MIQMTVTIRHLRHISRNYYGTAAPGAFAAIGAAVPAGKRRYIFFVRVWHDSPNTQIISLFRDGAVGAVPMDYFQLPGIGPLVGFEVGNPIAELALNIETPIYILESAQTLGIGSALLTNSYILACGYDEP